MRQRDGKVQEDPRAPEPLNAAASECQEVFERSKLTMTAGILTCIKDTHGDEPTVVRKMVQAHNRLPKAFQNKEDTCTPSSKIS